MLPWSKKDRARRGRASNRSAGATDPGQDRARTPGSALWRRIVIFNLIALNSVVIGVLYFGGAQDTLVRQSADNLLRTVTLMSGAIQARAPDDTPQNAPSGAAPTDLEPLRALSPSAGSEIWLFDRNGRLLDHEVWPADAGTPRSAQPETPIMDGLDQIGDWLTGGSRATSAPERSRPSDDVARDIAERVLATGTGMRNDDIASGSPLIAAAPVGAGPAPAAVLVLADTAHARNGLIRSERERALRILLVAVLISVGLGLTLIARIAGPLADLATPAETARERAGQAPDSVGRRRLSDMTAGADEIGRLSESLRGMVTALYQRIESNEQFLADVAHEMNNPLTSLRFAVDTVRTSPRLDQRERLFDVIDHDVRRLERLVNDIASASRLDSDLVKEETTRFDLVAMLRTQSAGLEPRAERKGVTILTELPGQPIFIDGLESRLAQVFVNLITNAISFCEAGDTIRIWARRRAGRVLVVVEDTGPGIPPDGLDRIFERFYSNRPDADFGNHSGLGLAISKQIVEAHDGVIWAENIQPAEADATSDPLGARFVVGLSV